MKHVFIYIYRQRRFLLTISLIGFAAMLLLASAWIFFPEDSLFEPVIVFLGFLVAILELLPSAILNAYPDAKYRLSAQPVYGGILKIKSEEFIVTNKSGSDFNDKRVKSIQPFLKIENNSDTAVQVKGLEIYDPNEKKDIKDIKIKDNIISGVSNFEPKEIMVGEAHHLPLTPFLDSISFNHRMLVIMSDGCKVALPEALIQDILGMKK